MDGWKAANSAFAAGVSNIQLKLIEINICLAIFCWEKKTALKKMLCFSISSCLWVERLSLHTCHAYVNTKLRQLIYMKRLVWRGLGLVLREAALSSRESVPSRWCGAGPGHSLHRNTWQRVLPRLSSRFSGVFIRVIQSKWFWLVYAKGELSSLAVHKGISLRKSEKEKKRRRCLWAHNWQNELLLSLAKRLMHSLTHTTLILAYVTHTV